MKILILHNRYKMPGGEDSVLDSEVELLIEKGNMVETLIWDNKDISTFSDKIKTGIFSVYNPYSADVLRKKIIDFNPEIIHVHNFFPRISPSSFFVADKMNIPVVMTLHNYRLICSNSILWTRGSVCEKCTGRVVPFSGIRLRCYRNSFFQTSNVTAVTSFHKVAGTWRKKVDRYITLTNFQKNKVMNSSLKLDVKKMAVKPNFISDYGDGIKKRDDFFLYIGRLSEEKGIGTLLESQKFFPYKLKIVGDGNLKPLVEKEVKSNKNLEFPGYMGKEHVIDLMKRSKALIFPSEWYEGFPVVIAEAFSTGTPVITTDIGSQAEIVKDGISGLHFRTSDPADLADKVKLIEKKGMKKLYENARKTYLENYTPEINYKILMKIYKEAIDEKKKNNFN